MKALIMMLHNQKEDSYHPIFYFEHPLPGGDENQTVTRFKSKGHHTTGFKDRGDAMKSIQTGIIDPINEHFKYEIIKELDGDMEWDGEGVPADNQLR